MLAAFAALFRPTATWRTPPRGHFLKMRPRAKGSARPCRSNVKTTPQRPGVEVYFPNSSLSSLSQVRPQAERAVKFLALVEIVPLCGRSRGRITLRRSKLKA